MNLHQCRERLADVPSYQKVGSAPEKGESSIRAAQAQKCAFRRIGPAGRDLPVAPAKLNVEKRGPRPGAPCNCRAQHCVLFLKTICKRSVRGCADVRLRVANHLGYFARTHRPWLPALLVLETPAMRSQRHRPSRPRCKRGRCSQTQSYPSGSTCTRPLRFVLVGDPCCGCPQPEQSDRSQTRPASTCGSGRNPTGGRPPLCQ